MKQIYILSLAFSWILVSGIFTTELGAQSLIEGLEVETYYAADSDDIAFENIDDNIYPLQEGSVTYRIFLDLADGAKLKSFYADENHPFYLTSANPIWNHGDRGETWGFDMNDSRLDENTVALDSWFSFGAATDEHWGVVKTEDQDGSVFATDENDLLNNNDSHSGRSIQDADGLIPAEFETTPMNLVNSGDLFEDVFGEEIYSNEFHSTNFKVQTAGFSPECPGNKILIAQITTVGEIEFVFNLELMNAQGVVKKYTGNENTENGEVFSAFLKYPPSCGCTDPNYVEYNPAALCFEEGSCQELAVFGCGDEDACNFDPNVNMNIEELCCYGPGDCNGLSVEILCPQTVGIDENGEKEIALSLFPNPTSNILNLEIDSYWSLDEITCAIFDLNGRKVKEQMLGGGQGDLLFPISVNELERGMYIIHIQVEEKIIVRRFSKS